MQDLQKNSTVNIQILHGGKRLRDGKGGRHLQRHTDSLLKSSFKKLVTPLSTFCTKSSNKFSKTFGKSVNQDAQFNCFLAQSWSKIVKLPIKPIFFIIPCLTFSTYGISLSWKKILKENMTSGSLTGHLATPSPHQRKRNFTYRPFFEDRINLTHCLIATTR